MNKIKKIFSLMIAVVFCLTIHAMPAAAADESSNEIENWEDYITFESNIEGVTFEITSLEVVPDSRASYATGNTSFTTFGKAVLTVPANTPLTSAQSFARLASGGSLANQSIKITGEGFNYVSVPISESYYTVSQFTGIPSRPILMQYEFQFEGPVGINVGIALYFS